MGFSVDEIRRMSMSDYYAFVDEYCRSAHPADSQEGGGVREATQADIDRLMT